MKTMNHSKSFLLSRIIKFTKQGKKYRRCPFDESSLVQRTVRSPLYIHPNFVNLFTFRKCLQTSGVFIHYEPRLEPRFFFFPWSNPLETSNTIPSRRGLASHSETIAAVYIVRSLHSRNEISRIRRGDQTLLETRKTLRKDESSARSRTLANAGRWDRRQRVSNDRVVPKADNRRG